MKRWLIAAALVSSVCSARAPADTLEYLDTEMLTFGSFYSDGFGTGQDITQSSGGHPGRYLLASQSVPPGTTSLRFRNQDKGIFYEPAQYGALTSIDYSIDTRWVTATDFGGMKTGLILYQFSRGTFFLDPAVTVTQPVWTTQTRLNLGPQDFVTYTIQGQVDPTRHPDFSAGADQISMGYFYQLDSVPEASRQFSIGVDNVRVTFNYVPEPSSWVLAGIGVIALSATCRWRHRLARPTAKRANGTKAWRVEPTS